MRKRLVIIFISALIGFLTLKLISKQFANTDTIIGRISNVLNRNNSIDLKCVGIDKKEINITWDSEDTKPKLIVKDGKQSKQIEHIYGPNRFGIQLTNGLEFNVGHFKTNNWHSHKYEIEIKSDSLSYNIKFIANGPDFEWIEQNFNLNGILNGQTQSFYINGKRSFKGNYVDGLQQESFIYYHRNGQVRVINEFLNDTLHGYTTYYDENGNIESKKRYLKGKKINTNK